MSQLRRIIEAVQKNPSNPFNGREPTYRDIVRVRHQFRMEISSEKSMMSKAEYLEAKRPKPTREE